MLMIYEYAKGIRDIPWGEALKERLREKSTESGQDIFFSTQSTFRESADGPRCLVDVQCTEKGQAGVKHISLPFSFLSWLPRVSILSNKAHKKQNKTEN